MELTTQSADMKPTFSQRLARYISGERFERIDAEARSRAKHIVAYHLGLAFRGIAAKDQESMRAIAVARELSEGGGSSTLIGHRDKLTLVDAVLANCQLMRSFGLDDVIFKTGVHPGLVTLPIALAIGERLRISGAQLLTSIVVGYEMLGKFAQWSWSLDTPRRATMPFGPFGALATASKALGFDAPQTTVALGYAAHTAMGLAENDSGPISHYYGMVCRNALTGAWLARAGAWASPTVLEGRFGFLEAFLGSATIDQEAMVASLGHDYAILQSCEKRYPGTGLNQVPIEHMREIVKAEGLRVADIESIHVDFPVERENFGGGHGKGPFTPQTSPSSVAFQFALLLLDGDLRLARYAEVDNPAILGIVDRTTFSFIPKKSIRYARLDVRTKDGRRFMREGDEFFFTPETPRAIMERDAANILPPEKIERAIGLIERLDLLDDVSLLTECLTP